MKLSLKIRSRSHVFATSAALLCAYLLFSCGLGTEVGNGAKDKDKDGKGTNAANTEPESSGDQDPSPSEENGQGKEPSHVKVPADYGIDLAIIFNSCGSPFEPMYKMPFILSGNAKSGNKVKLNGKFDAKSDALLVSDSNQEILAHIRDDINAGDHKVTVSKKDGSTYQSSYACSEVVETDDASIYSYSVILTPVNADGVIDENKPEITLSWIVNKTQSIPELTSISVTAEEVELLKLTSGTE